MRTFSSAAAILVAVFGIGVFLKVRANSQTTVDRAQGVAEPAGEKRASAPSPTSAPPPKFTQGVIENESEKRLKRAGQMGAEALRQLETQAASGADEPGEEIKLRQARADTRERESRTMAAQAIGVSESEKGRLEEIFRQLEQKRSDYYAARAEKQDHRDLVTQAGDIARLRAEADASVRQVLGPDRALEFWKAQHRARRDLIRQAFPDPKDRR